MKPWTWYRDHIPYCQRDRNREDGGARGLPGSFELLSLLYPAEAPGLSGISMPSTSSSGGWAWSCSKDDCAQKREKEVDTEDAPKENIIRNNCPRLYS